MNIVWQHLGSALEVSEKKMEDFMKEPREYSLKISLREILKKLLYDI